MANFVTRNGRVRALVRKQGHTRCATLGTKREAAAWAARVEKEIDEIRATELLNPKSMTIAASEKYVSLERVTECLLHGLR